MKTSELTGAALDWAVEVAFLSARIKNVEQRAAIASRNRRVSKVGYSTDWTQGGLIIEQECISVEHDISIKHKDGWWHSELVATSEDDFGALSHAQGPTPLIAAMRCFVQSKLGDDVGIPEELL